jgi:hypothetical protein
MRVRLIVMPPIETLMVPRITVCFKLTVIIGALGTLNPNTMNVELVVTVCLTAKEMRIVLTLFTDNKDILRGMDTNTISQNATTIPSIVETILYHQLLNNIIPSIVKNNIK